MLTQIVLIQQGLLHSRQPAPAGGRKSPYRRSLPARWRYAPRLRRSCPSERAVGMDQHAGHLRRVDSLLAEGFDNHVAGFPLIVAVDLASVINRCRAPAIKVVGMGSAGRGNRLPGLRPNGGVARMGMHNAAQRRESLIQQAMGRGIRRGLLLPSTTSPLSRLTTTISSAVITR